MRKKFATSVPQLTVSSNIKHVCHWPVIVWPAFILVQQTKFLSDAGRPTAQQLQPS